MAFFEWTDEYRINVPLIDAQHERLFEIANDLFDAVRVGAGREVLERTLSKLVAYTIGHFAAEERLMERWGYAGMAAHRKEHEAFRAQVLGFQREFSAGNRRLSVELMYLLRDWLDEHIKGTDHQLAPYVAEPVGRR